MSEKQTFNYRQIMSEPIEIQRLTDKFSLPVPIKITSIGIFILVDLVMFMLVNNVIVAINFQIPGIVFAVYIGMPYGIIKVLEKLNLDGLRVDQYLISRITFFKEVIMTNKVLYQGKYVKTIDQQIVFSRIHAMK